MSFHVLYIYMYVYVQSTVPLFIRDRDLITSLAHQLYSLSPFIVLQTSRPPTLDLCGAVRGV